MKLLLDTHLLEGVLLLTSDALVACYHGSVQWV